MPSGANVFSVSNVGCSKFSIIDMILATRNHPMGKNDGVGNASAALIGGVIGAVTTAAAAYIIVSNQRKQPSDNPGKDESGESEQSPSVGVGVGVGGMAVPERRPQTPSSRVATLPPEIRQEQLSRNQLYFGDSGMETVAASSVCVVGLGGVGSHAAHMLARSGIRYLRLIDFDQVTVSSLNRHACATLKDVGTPKVEAMRKFLVSVCPDTTFLDVDARTRMYTGDPSKDGDLLSPPGGTGDGDWDVIIDAIDDVPTKARLIAHCVRNRIRCVSCMGAGGKADFTRLHASDLRTASRDPLAAKLRQTIKRLLKGCDVVKDDSYMDDPDLISVIYSSEKVVAKLADFTDEQKAEGADKFGAMDGMRVRVLPVLGTMPAIMGQACAALALCELGGKPISPVAGERVGKSVRHRMYQHLKRREKLIRDGLEARLSAEELEKLVRVSNDGDDRRSACFIYGKWVGSIQVDGDDVEYLLAEIWRNRCAVTGDRLGTVLELVRWDITKPSDCTNLVLMGARALEKFDKAEGDGRNTVAPEVQRKIERRLATCRVDFNA